MSNLEMLANYDTIVGNEMLEKFDTWVDSLSLPANRKKGFITFLAVLSVMTFVSYFKFIVGQKALIYVGTGSDSYAQSVPFFLNAALRFANGIYSTWNPSQFLGAITYESWNPEYVISLFGTEGVLWGMLWCQIAKVILAGVFCYLYTGWLDTSWRTRFIVSLGYAFCGRMVAISAWTSYTMEVTFAMTILWAFERFFHDKRKFISLPISFGLMFSLLSAYGFVLYSAIFVAYSICRICYEGQIPDKSRTILIFAIQLLVLWLLGVALALPGLLPTTRVYANSARVSSNILAGQSNAANFVVSLFTAISTTQTLATEAVNTFATGGLGYMDKYLGPTSILDSPYFYCGLLTVISTPLSLVNTTKRQKVWVIIPASFALLYCLMPNFRYLLSGFGVGSDDFRMSSFFVELIVVYLGTLGMENLWHHATRRQIVIVFSIALCLLVFGTFVLYPRVAKRPIALAGMLVVIYALLILLARKPGRGSLAALLVIALPIELVLANFRMINHVPTITSDDFRSSFYDTSVRALSQSGEDASTQRIDDQGGLLTSSMAGSFLSTKMYIGGAGINRQTTDFLANVGNDYVETSGYTRYAYGFHGNELNDLLGVGYLAIPNYHDDIEPAVPYGYEKLDYDGNWYLYKNAYSLPLMYGYTQSEAMSRTSFLGINRDDRPAAMLSNIVLPDDIAQTDNVTSAPFISTSATEFTSIASTSQNLVPGDVINLNLPEEGRQQYLVFDMDLSATSTVSGNLYVNIPLYMNSGDEKPVSQARYRTAAGKEHIRIVLADKGYGHACVTISDVNNTPDPVVTNVRVSAVGKDYFDGYREAYENRMSSNPTVTDYGNDYIEGTINLSEDGYVTVPFSWEKSWHAYIDGEETSVFTANLGFMGVKVPAGQHTVRFEYRDQEFAIGLVCAGISGVGLVGTWSGVRARGRRSRNRLALGRHMKTSK